MITTKKNEQLSQAPVIGSPKFIPILFSTEMVKAILSGSKNQTRRKLKKQPDLTKHSHISKGVVLDGKNRETFMFCTGSSNVVENIFCPYGQPGDVLWVRETFYSQGYWEPCGISKKGKQKYRFVDDNVWDKNMPDRGYKYETNKPIDVLKGKSKIRGYYKRPSLFMPKEACRIFLLVKSVRVERLQDISRGDAMSEGCPFPNIAKETNPVAWFAALWQKINGFKSWNDNPFVWVIEFERIERPAGFL